MTAEFQYRPTEEGMNRLLEKAVPGTGKVNMDLDEASGRIMVWADAPGILVRVVHGQLLVQAVAQGGG